LSPVSPICQCSRTWKLSSIHLGTCVLSPCLWFSPKIFVTLSSDTASLNSVIFCFTTGSDSERIRGRTGSLICNLFRCLNAAVAVEEPLPSAALCSRGARRWRACCWCDCGEPRMVVVVVVYLLEKSIITSQSCSCWIVCGVSLCVFRFAPLQARWLEEWVVSPAGGWRNVVGTVRSITSASDYLYSITNRKVGVIPDMAIITLLLASMNLVRLVIICRSLVSWNTCWMLQNKLITAVRWEIYSRCPIPAVSSASRHLDIHLEYHLRFIILLKIFEGLIANFIEPSYPILMYCIIPPF
jgi:hypothetical protein